MKKHFIFILSFSLSLLLSCSNTKEKYNKELAQDMKLEVNFINNQMPRIDNTSSRYIAFMVTPINGAFDENWKTVSLTATSKDLKVEVLKFDKNDFEAKGEKVYRNSARQGLSDLGSTIDITVVLLNEQGERIKLSKSDVQEEVVQ